MEETPKITSVKKEKDPKRVEAGKKLAAISKEAKERKMRERIEKEKEEEKENSWNISNSYLLAGGSVLALALFYLIKKPEKKEAVHNKSKIEEPKKQNNACMDEPSFKFDTLD